MYFERKTNHTEKSIISSFELFEESILYIYVCTYIHQFINNYI